MPDAKKANTLRRISEFSVLIGALSDACKDIDRCHKNGIDVYLRALQMLSNLAAVFAADKALRESTPSEGTSSKKEDLQPDLFDTYPGDRSDPSG